MSALAQLEAQELTVIDRARKALSFDQTKAQLAELAKQSERIVEITNAAGREECHAAAMALTKQRTTITQTGKAARDDANKFSAAVIAAEKELLGIITPEEIRLRGLRDRWDADRAAEKQAAIDAENARVAGIQARIQEFKDRPMVAAGCGSSSIADVICVTELEPVDDSFAEFAPQAQVAKEEALAKLREMHTKAVASEAEAKRIADEQAAAAEQLRKDREELERLRAEAAERQAKADAEAKAAREEADRLARIERERQAEEQLAKLAAEAAARRQQEEAEREQLRAERARIAEQAAELKRQQEEQAARELAERQRVEAERAAQKAEAERIKMERVTAEREREIANATLHSAAHDALVLLNELGQSENIVTLKLVAALARECA